MDIEVIRCFLQTHPLFYVIAVFETKLGSEVANDNPLVELDGLSFFRHDRNTRGGRVILNVHVSLTAVELCTSFHARSVNYDFLEFRFC